MSKENLVKIPCKRPHQIVKRGFMINDLPIAKDSSLRTQEEMPEQLQGTLITAETKNGTEDIPDSDLFQWMREATLQVIALEDEINFKADLTDDPRQEELIC